jgi:beta-phosphoglucomutase-like phosphatase (HAD superfamily)
LDSTCNPSSTSTSILPTSACASPIQLSSTWRWSNWVAPQQAVFLDDSLRNVDSARELGIHTIQFVDPVTSLAELEALLGHPTR